MSENAFWNQHDGNPAENYERYFVPAIGAPLARALVAVLEPRAGERVLDVACGTGIVARLAAERVGPTGSVAGADIHPGMLSVARAATPEGTSIAWYETGAEAMPLPDDAFDVVACQMGLQFFSDKAAAAREMRRVLRPGGRVGINVPGPIPPLFEIFAEELARHIGPKPASFARVVFSLHDADELRALFEAAGFRRVFVKSTTENLRLPPSREFLWQYIHSTPLHAALASSDDPHRAALERDVCARWAEFETGAGLGFDVRVTTVTAEA